MEEGYLRYVPEAMRNKLARHSEFPIVGHFSTLIATHEDPRISRPFSLFLSSHFVAPTHDSTPRFLIYLRVSPIRWIARELAPSPAEEIRLVNGKSLEKGNFSFLTNALIVDHTNYSVWLAAQTSDYMTYHVFAIVAPLETADEIPELEVAMEAVSR